MENVRVRFAPSPTGGLHIGGVRTALFNYLFAKKHQGKLILRIEDTDQARYVKGSEEYIRNALSWCGICFDEGPDQEGDYGPYKQSDRKDIYGRYAEKLVNLDYAYYAFDTPEELEVMRQRLKSNRVMHPQYDTVTRMTMKNSLTLSKEEVTRRIEGGVPYVIRIKTPRKEEIRFNDMVRGWIMVRTEVLEDKVLMKSDGMPTYHLANVVDDYLMKITHVIRGEEWIPSAPIHVLLYHFFGWENQIPQFGHLPLILTFDGNGKLSKRTADKAGFPIFPMNWTDPITKELSEGFKETGFLPEALVNFLAFLGWNPGTEQEIFSFEGLVEAFSIEQVNKAGTKFDFDKAKWFNKQYIKQKPSTIFIPKLIEELKRLHHINCSKKNAEQMIDLLKGRVTFLGEFVEKSAFLFKETVHYDETMIRNKWNKDSFKALSFFADKLETQEEISPAVAKTLFGETLKQAGYNPGQFMPILRVVLTGEGSGPDLMTIIGIMGAKNVAKRIKLFLMTLSNKN